MQNPEATQFGEKTVRPEEKTGLVHDVFDNVADKYDLMNDLMSGGIHRLWKDRLIREIRPKAGQRFLDVAGGTGDIAFRLYKRTGYAENITICDLTHNMLSVGRDRAINKGWKEEFQWTNGNAEALPFSDNSFDVYTIAFGLRNVTHIDTAIKEAYRVLRPGGQFFCLEFSHVENPIMAKGYDFYSFGLIPKMGKIIAKDKESYQYLVESIRKFPKQKELQKRINNVGFIKSRYINLTGGIVAIHRGLKT